MFLTHKISKQAFISTLLILPLVLSTALPVFAAAETQFPQSGLLDKNDEGDFEERLERLTQYLDKQTQNINLAEEKLLNAQSRIEELQSEGNDTQLLKENLIQLQNSLEEAVQYHDLAVQILSYHPGFNDEGKLENEALARETLSNAAKNLKACQESLKSAIEQAGTAREEYVTSLTPDKQQLETYYQKAAENQKVIQETLGRVEENIETATEKLAEMEEQGQDVSEFTEALNDYKNILEENLAYYQDFETLLSGHPGFDADQQVDDIDLARETIFSLQDLYKNMRSNLIRARQILKVNQRLFTFVFQAKNNFTAE